MHISVQLPAWSRNMYPSVKHANNIIIFKACLAGNIRAFPVISSDNFPKAIIDPVKVIAPINTPKKTSTLCIVSSELEKSECGSRAELITINTAANQTNE